MASSEPETFGNTVHEIEGLALGNPGRYGLTSKSSDGKGGRHSELISTPPSTKGSIMMICIRENH